MNITLFHTRSLALWWPSSPETRLNLTRFSRSNQSILCLLSFVLDFWYSLSGFDDNLLKIQRRSEFLQERCWSESDGRNCLKLESCLDEWSGLRESYGSGATFEWGEFDGFLSIRLIWKYLIYSFIHKPRLSFRITASARQMRWKRWTCISCGLFWNFFFISMCFSWRIHWCQTQNYCKYKLNNKKIEQLQAYGTTFTLIEFVLISLE